MEQKSTINVANVGKFINPAIHCLDFKKDGTTILVGTINADIIELN